MNMCTYRNKVKLKTLCIECSKTSKVNTDIDYKGYICWKTKDIHGCEITGFYQSFMFLTIQKRAF